MAAKDCLNGVFWANSTVTSGKRQEVSSLEGPTPITLSSAAIHKGRSILVTLPSPHPLGRQPLFFTSMLREIADPSYVRPRSDDMTDNSVYINPSRTDYSYIHNQPTVNLGRTDLRDKQRHFSRTTRIMAACIFCRIIKGTYSGYLLDV